MKLDYIIWMRLELSYGMKLDLYYFNGVEISCLNGVGFKLLKDIGVRLFRWGRNGADKIWIVRGYENQLEQVSALTNQKGYDKALTKWD